MNSERKLILYIACSADGFIAGPGDDLGFLSSVQKEGEDYGYADFMAQVDTVIMGRRTYDWVMKQVDVFPHINLKTYIRTRTEQAAKGNIIFYTGDLNELVKKLKSEQGKHIFCDGGASVVNDLLASKLIDEMIISIIPVLLGRGVRLFNEKRPEQAMRLVSSRQFESGLVQLHYKLMS